ncbi:hypothetical protein Tco_0547427, partial [Tanacetum coccineum]
SSKESLEKGYDRYQKLLSQLDALGAGGSGYSRKRAKRKPKASNSKHGVEKAKSKV